MSDKKKQIRAKFRDDVFIRDRYSCVMCGVKADKSNPELILDAHHVTNRNEMENGGYVKENGISLCKAVCHLKAEEYLQGTVLHEGFSPAELYQKIKSSLEQAHKASKKLY